MRMILFLLSFLFLNAASAGNSGYQYELRTTANGTQEIWFYHPTFKEDVKLGIVETWKKGTTLFHWANATPSQAQAWNDAGKISESVLENLKIHNVGAAGGGFYASTSPTDSISYGNTLVVVTLPKDMRVVRTVTSGGVDVHVHAKDLEEMKFSAVTVDHTRTWLNVVDVNMLTQEFVADENFFRTYRFEKLPKPESLELLLTRFPNLRQETYYKDLISEAKQLRKDFKSTNREVAHAAILKAIDKADSPLLTDLFSELRPSYINEEVINKVTTLMKIQDGLFGLANSVLYYGSKNEKLRYRAYQAMITSSAPPESMPALLEKVSTRDASNLLNEALEVHGENLPNKLRDLIQKMKREGTWKPEIICSKIFAS